MSEEITVQPPTVTDIDHQLALLDQEIETTANEYYDIMQTLGKLRANRYIQEARDLIAEHEKEEWQGYELKVAVKGAYALTAPDTVDAMTHYYEALEKSRGIKEKLRSLQNRLTAVQTRAGLLRTEASLIGYQ